MEQSVSTFSSRQWVNASDFQFFHSFDRHAPKVEYHNHDFYEVYFLISGDVVYMIEGKSYKLRPGDIILINNRELHRPFIGSGTTYERFVIWLRPEFVRRLSDGRADLCACFEQTARNRSNLLRPGSEIFSAVKKDILHLEDLFTGESGFGDEVLKKSYLMELIVYLNRAFLESRYELIRGDVEYNPKINDLVLYINENLSADLSLDELSARFYISKYHLLREFKKYTGFTIHHFIQKKRLILAKSVLLEGRSAKEAYIQSGFGNYSNFSKSFKGEFGVSPRRFAEAGGIP